MHVRVHAQRDGLLLPVRAHVLLLGVLAVRRAPAHPVRSPLPDATAEPAKIEAAAKKKPAEPSLFDKYAPCGLRGGWRQDTCRAWCKRRLTEHLTDSDSDTIHVSDVR